MAAEDVAGLAEEVGLGAEDTIEGMIVDILLAEVATVAATEVDEVDMRLIEGLQGATEVVRGILVM